MGSAKKATQQKEKTPENTNLVLYDHCIELEPKAPNRSKIRKESARSFGSRFGLPCSGGLLRSLLAVCIASESLSHMIEIATIGIPPH